MDKLRHVSSLLVVTTLLAGMLSGCSSRTTPAPVEELYTGKTYKDYEPNSLQANSYQVTQGETLYSIAFRANKDVSVVARLNDLSEPYTIYPGQILKLTDDSVQTRQQKPVAQSKRHNDTQKKSKKDIKPSVAKPLQKEYGQKVVAKKAAKKQVANSVSRQSKPAETEALKIPKPSAGVNVANKDIHWQWPSKGDVIATFSTAERGNKGLDFAGKRGDPVTAAAAGKVVYVGDALPAFGQLIILKHNDDFITAYAHNDSILVKEQDWVDVGQVIARMGSSGTQRVKLHFEVRYRGKSVNPKHYLPQ